MLLLHVHLILAARAYHSCRAEHLTRVAAGRGDTKCAAGLRGSRVVYTSKDVTTDPASTEADATKEFVNSDPSTGALAAELRYQNRAIFKPLACGIIRIN